MCGIVGIYSYKPVATELVDSLIHLQHRGQDAAGIITEEAGHFHIKKGHGLVQEIFATEVNELKGNIGLGHTRYPTAGGYNIADVQPLNTSQPFQIALAHNGNVVDHQKLETQNKIRTSSIDSETLLHLLIENMGSTSAEIDSLTFFETLCLTVQHVMKVAAGSFSVITLIAGRGLVAFRDSHGIRPLVLGQRRNQQDKIEYIIASENTMFYPLGFELMGDVAPGEIVYISEVGKLTRRLLHQKTFAPCIFEYVYFARPDAILNEVGVYRSRLHMGQNLAKQWQAAHPEIRPDVVIPAPFTSNTAALAFAHELGVRYSEGLYKNPFIGRTFIMPDGQKRSRTVRHKLIPQRAEIENLKVLILDDSLVRGTTSAEIVKMVREYGAKEIYFVLACPPIINPCFYGIDMPTRMELMAANLNQEQIRQKLGVDKLLYLSIDSLVEAVNRGHPEIKSPCMACMNGHYISGDITEAKIEALQNLRLKDKIPA